MKYNSKYKYVAFIDDGAIVGFTSIWDAKCFADSIIYKTFDLYDEFGNHIEVRE